MRQSRALIPAVNVFGNPRVVDAALKALKAADEASRSTSSFDDEQHAARATRTLMLAVRREIDAPKSLHSRVLGR